MQNFIQNKQYFIDLFHEKYENYIIEDPKVENRQLNLEKVVCIIGIQNNQHDQKRLQNLHILLRYMNKYYDSLLDIIIVEQSIKESSNLKELETIYPSVFYRHLYNPSDYNRGWGYNTAVKEFCKNYDVIVFMDTDILPGKNFLKEIEFCLEGVYDVISPYKHIYYTNSVERKLIEQELSVFSLKDIVFKNPVTITGGIVIFNKKKFLELYGFEQYIGYGGEDRALDVLILEYFPKEKIRIAIDIYVHLFHEIDPKQKKISFKIFQHLKDVYKCFYSKETKKNEFIHSYCSHATREELNQAILKKQRDFGDKNLYKNYTLTINGATMQEEAIICNTNIILPPNFQNLKNYTLKERNNIPCCESELSKLYNKYLGKRCFIIGNGPSLNLHDLSLLKDEYTFAVNSFYYKTREIGFRPTFYVVEDTSVMKENLDEIRKYHAQYRFFPTIYKNLISKDSNTYFFTMNRGFYEKSSPNYCVPRFSTDITKEIFCGQSVTYINLQLAYFMGFSEVYLIGMDFSYIIPKSHKRNGDVLLSDSDDMNHFHKDYFGAGKTWKDPKLDRVAQNYKMAKLVFESTNRRIYNATIGGNLEIFPRVNYSDICMNCQKKYKKCDDEIYTVVDQNIDTLKYEHIINLIKENEIELAAKYLKYIENLDSSAWKDMRFKKIKQLLEILS
ncbi:TPA: 6-hydroxymethylpterin diphosphokinase MptE-like protein [Campylobacter jejuni]|uniref:6-hydroxymethylpterin diphosphokinase MptE-like protein n=1 Tax=Campylobacter jejuni TaxID=197 RepID=UPI000F80CCB0|nr:6-hydroxymethylpterin diphosphokinase MptE-like protein [Campylobacter jejuni]RTJ34351.1 glycosyl transferase family 2 [Campylobacter jejuni]